MSILFKKAQQGLKFRNLKEEAKELTSKHKDLPWINRVLSGSTLGIKNAEGVSSHRLMYGEDEHGNYFVYPRIVEVDGELEELTEENAWRHAVENKTRLPVKDKAMADYYSKQGLIDHPEHGRDYHFGIDFKTRYIE